VDAQTLETYDRLAASYADEWEQQPDPSDLYSLIDEYFVPGPVADVGCGSGRDTAWLCGHGFQAVGFDASEGLLAEARRRHPGIEFTLARLPELDGVAAGAYANVLCETVIMHLAPADVGPSVRRLVELVAPDGTLYVSWRVPERDGWRDARGRVYHTVDPEVVGAALDGTTVLDEATTTSESSGKTIHRIVARRHP
jgi:SAM-dependent methyltransferase